MIEINKIRASLDFMLMADNETPVVLSFFDRSSQVVRSIGAGLNSRSVCLKKTTYPYPRTCQFRNNEGFDVYISPVVYGKEKFYHALAISKGLNKDFILSTDEKMAEHFYHFLMKNYDLPILNDWSDVLIQHGIREGTLNSCHNCLLLGKDSISDIMPLGKEKILLSDIRVLSCKLTDESLKQHVSYLLQSKKIWISKREQTPLEFENMDSYFSKYGHTLVENLERLLEPLTELDGNIDNMCLRHMRLFPQQAAQVNAVVKRLHNASYCILNNGMGTGKTIEGASICEAYHVDKWLKKHPNKSLREAYSDPGNINYRVIVMCPGHLVNKWAAEINREIPYSKVTILKDISQVVDIKAGGIKRNGREFFILSKDFAKLSYQKKPLPRVRRKGFLKVKQCSDCGEKIFSTSTTCKCGSYNINLVKSDIPALEAMVCPFCKNLLVPYKTNNFDMAQETLDYNSFTNNRESNDKCYYCGESLWAPHVPNIGENRHNVWYRATHYKDKAHKNTCTVWVHTSYADQYFENIDEEPLNVIDAETHFGIRKVSPAYFIKKQLKGFFDFAIFDEAHLYKGAGTAQGNAMHSFIKASKKQLALTGTIAGGYASHLFYLLYRLDPHRMKCSGYNWNNVMSFVDKYGQKETEFECNESDGIYNTSSRGRQKGSPKEKPGISPLIFTDFLLDSSVFLDLSDMSKYLPTLKEYVETVDVPALIEDSNGDMIDNPEWLMLEHYNRMLDILQQMSKKKGGKTLLSSMLHLALSYIDHPYGTEPIIHPMDGSQVIAPMHFEMFKDENTLLAKEKRLIELINKEQSEGRNCFVFAEYTGSPSTCVSYRLKEIIERHCNLKGKVAVLEASFPSASKREEWMHKKATEGIRIFITNPKNVETGLDFCFKEDGVLYNYPTLIFYQLGHSLFTIWQASRRHFRLNQREECRTYYMAVSGTIQQTVISLIAQKMAATSAIQGKFSVEGLSSMAQGIDVKLKLAQSLANMDAQNGANLQEMFDVLQANDNSTDMYGNYHMMLTLEELVGDIVNKIPTEIVNDDNDFIDPFDIFELFDNMDEDILASNSFVNTKPMVIPDNKGVSINLSDTPLFTTVTKKELKKIPIGQMMIVI